MRQRRINSFSTFTSVLKKPKFSPNTSFSIHTSSPDTTFSGNNNNYVTKKKPIWNSSTRFSGIVHDDVSVNTRHWKSKQNLYQGLEKNNDSDPTIRDWKNKKNRVKGLQTIMMNGTANKDEKVNGRPRSDSIPGLKIYSIWSQKLAKDQISGEAAWNRCRLITMEALQKFTDRLELLEKVTCPYIHGDSVLDLNTIEEKRKEIEAALFEVEDYDIEMKEVAKALQNVAQFLPPVEERENMKNNIVEVRKRYFKILQELIRQKELCRWLVPLLEQYRDHGSDIKSWLDITETRSEVFTRDFNNNDLILKNEELIESIREELFTQKDVYEDFLEASEAIMDLLIDANLVELRLDHDHVVERWDSLCSNIEKCYNRLSVAKKAAMESVTKTDPEKIERKIRTEAKKCTCHIPFQIIKVGEGKYTFGTSKIVRLLRVHGNSIVVRVGGGWEYLYDFLFKADPCRAKQAMDSNSQEMKSLDLSGLDLMPIDKKSSSFSLNVQRMTPKSWTPYRNSRYERSGSLGSAASSTDNIDYEDSSDSYSLSNSTGSSTPTSRPSSRINYTPTGRKLSQGNKYIGSLDNINKKEKRLSLIERQAIYAEKKKMAQAFEVS